MAAETLQIASGDTWQLNKTDQAMAAILGRDTMAAVAASFGVAEAVAAETYPLEAEFAARKLKALQSVLHGRLLPADCALNWDISRDYSGALRIEPVFTRPGYTAKIVNTYEKDPEKPEKRHLVRSLEWQRTDEAQMQHWHMRPA